MADSEDRVAARAEDLGLKLGSDALDALADLPEEEADDLMQQLVDRGDAIRNVDRYVLQTAERIKKGKGNPGRKGEGKGGEGKGKGGKSAARAEELGLELSAKALDALRSIPLSEAMGLIEEAASRTDEIRNPSGYVASACARIAANEGKGGSGKGAGGGGKSAARAQELGLRLDGEAEAALASVSLQQAYQLLDDVSAKGVGKHGGIKNLTGYITSACGKMLSSAGSPPWAQQQWAIQPVRPEASYLGNKSAARARELGIELADEALEALANVPLRDAFDLLDSIAAKGVGKGIRNPTGFVLGACAKMGGGQDLSYGKGKGYAAPAKQPLVMIAPKTSSIDLRVVELNRSGMWGSEKIDVEALVALKGVNSAVAQELLDSVQSGSVRNPSSYILAAISRMNAADGQKRGRSEYEGYKGAGKGGGKGGGNKGGGKDRGGKKGGGEIKTLISSHAKTLGLHLEDNALEALSAEPETAALNLLDQVADGLDKIKNPSKYIMSACHRGIDNEGPPAKRQRM